MEKDFKNMVVMNYGYVYGDTIDENLLEPRKELTKSKWFDYVVSDDVIDTLKNVLESKVLDSKVLKKIVYDDVLNTRNVIYSSLNEDKAIEQAKKLSEKTLVLRLQ